MAAAGAELEDGERTPFAVLLNDIVIRGDRTLRKWKCKVKKEVSLLFCFPHYRPFLGSCLLSASRLAGVCKAARTRTGTSYGVPVLVTDDPCRGAPRRQLQGVLGQQ